MRSLWKGAITFGLVHIPVKLYAATEDHDVHFRQLHRACHGPVEYRRWCPRCQQTLAREDIVKGYEWAPGEFVEIEASDLDNLPLASARSVDILDFVRADEVDPLYFDRGYYLGPSDGGARAFGLLRAVLAESHLAAVAKVALRAKESLCLVRVVAPALALETLYYPDEVRPVGEVDGAAQEVALAAREMEMARDLVNRLAGPWEPGRYRDEYAAALRARIEEKAQGRRVSPAEPAPREAAFTDLLSALEASVRLAEERRQGREPAVR